MVLFILRHLYCFGSVGAFFLAAVSFGHFAGHFSTADESSPQSAASAESAAEPDSAEDVFDEGIIPTSGDRSDAANSVKEAKRKIKNKDYSDAFRELLDTWQTIHGWRSSALTAEDHRLLSDATEQMKLCSEKLNKMKTPSLDKTLVLIY